MPGAPGISLEQAAMAVEAVESRGWTQAKAGELAGVSQSTVSDILSHKYRWGEVCQGPVFNALRFEQKRAFQAATLAVCRKALIQVDEKIDKASAYQAAGIYGLLRDKERLDAGEPTELIAIHTTLELTGVDAIADLLSRRLVNSNANESNAEIVQPNQTDTSLIK